MSPLPRRQRRNVCARIGRVRQSMGLWAAVVAGLLVVAVPAGAVTITEFDVEPGTALGVHLPRYIDTGPDGNLWFTDGGSRPGIGRITTAGQPLGQISTSSSPMDLAVAADGSGTVYFTGDRALLRRTADGAITSSPTPPSYAIALATNGGLRWGHKSDADSVEICSFQNEVWGALNACSNFLRRDVGPLTGMVVAPDGRLWSAWYGLDFVTQSINETSKAHARRFDLPAGSGPARLAVGSDGAIWVTMFDGSAIDRIAPGGAYTRFPLQPGRRPNDIAAGPDGVGGGSV